MSDAIPDTASSGVALWVPDGLALPDWVRQADGLSLLSAIPETSQGLVSALWPSAQSYVAQAITQGRLPSAALQDWMEEARRLGQRVDEMRLVDYDSALNDPLFLIETLGLDDSVAPQSDLRTISFDGVPALIAAEALRDDAAATELDAHLELLTLGRDATLDIDDMARRYGAALMDGNDAAVDALRDQLLARQLRRDAELPSDREDIDAPPSVASSVRQPQGEIRTLRRDIARGHAKVQRLEAVLNALLDDLDAADEALVDTDAAVWMPDPMGSVAPQAAVPTPPQPMPPPPGLQPAYFQPVVQAMAPAHAPQVPGSMPPQPYGAVPVGPQGYPQAPTYPPGHGYPPEMGAAPPHAYDTGAAPLGPDRESQTAVAPPQKRGFLGRFRRK